MWPDFVKIKVEGASIERLLLHPMLDFNCDYSRTTSELKDNKLVSQYRFGKIIINKSKNGGYHVTYSGSLHKLWNDLKGVVAPNYSPNKPYKGFNGNRFNYEGLQTAVNDLCQLFGCSPSQMLLQNIEFGINISVPFDVKMFIKGLLYHNGKMFEFKYDDNYAQVEHQQYFVKAYNKSQQFEMKDSVLRVEIKVVKMVTLKKNNITTLGSLTPEALIGLYNRLYDTLCEIVYYDYTLNKDVLTKPMQLAATNYSNPRFWFESISPHRRDRHKRKLNELINQFSENLKESALKEMASECVMINQILQKECVIINHSNIGLTVTTQNLSKLKKCVVTGLDISMQQRHSFHLSHTGLKHYYHYQISIFEEIRLRFLSEKWKDAPIHVQIKEIAHNIRNAASNRRIKLKRLYHPRQIKLFE